MYANHYNYEDIKDHLKDKKWNSGSDEINQLIKDVHNCSHENFLKMKIFEKIQFFSKKSHFFRKIMVGMGSRKNISSCKSMMSFLSSDAPM